jgi:hypothetical protein
MKARKRPGSLDGFKINNQKSTLAHASDKHLILRDGAAAFTSATIAASAISDQELETSGDALH